MLMKDPLNLIIAGVGGQGNVSMSFLIGSALVSKGYFVTVFDNYGASQRLGAVASHIKVSKEVLYTSPLLRKGDADIIIGIEPLELLRALLQFGNPNVVTIVNARPVYPVSVTSGEAVYPNLDKAIEAMRNLSARTWIINATEEALKLGSPVLTNAILIGALLGSGVLPLDKESMETVLKERFPKAVDMNMVALNKGLELNRGK